MLETVLPVCSREASDTCQARTGLAEVSLQRYSRAFEAQEHNVGNERTGVRGAPYKRGGVMH